MCRVGLEMVLTLVTAGLQSTVSRHAARRCAVSCFLLNRFESTNRLPNDNTQPYKELLAHKSPVVVTVSSEWVLPQNQRWGITGK